MEKVKVQSVEPQVADKFNAEFKKYEVDYKLEQESLNEQIDNALSSYASKSGGKGGNRPDAKAIIKDKYGNQWPILIEYKGYKGKLVKFDKAGIVENLNEKDKSPNFDNIKNYAVNGAIHYANALLHYTNYEKIIAIGITGYKENNDSDIKTELGVYYVSKDNFGLGQEIGKYENLSFLGKQHVDEFINKITDLSLTEKEKESRKLKREEEIYNAIGKLNREIYDSNSNENRNLSEEDRLYLIVATIIATIGVSSEESKNVVAPLEPKDLISSTELENRDGDIILRKIKAFLDAREQVPIPKRDLILNELKKVLQDDRINLPINGESQLKKVFTKIVEDIGIYYKIGLTTDFTGMLFNEMYRWLGYSENKNKTNDVVLTPSYIARLLVKLARVNMDSYVWDFACGSGGLLVAAMNEMINDAEKKLRNRPDECIKKKLNIKLNQILGIEILAQIYMLAILNMILMGDGSSNLLHKDSLLEFNGEYGFRKVGEKFPATAFVLNPPYSADGCGMTFVKKALSMMDKGYATVIIKSSAGSGNAESFNKDILKRNTLLASIKMPSDLFRGKSSVQTYIYVFKVAEAHTEKDNVKFIDFSNDGYTRMARKKSSKNLIDKDHAKERYQELVDLVTAENYNLNDLIYLKDKVYIGKIDVNNGADWNQSVPIDTRPTIQDFKKTVSDYLSWEVSNILKNKAEDDSLGK